VKTVLRCTAREHLAHDLVNRLGGQERAYMGDRVQPLLTDHPELAPLAAALALEPARLRVRLKRALEADHPGLVIADETYEHSSQGRYCYLSEQPPAEPVAPGDGPAVAALAAELIARVAAHAALVAHVDVLPAAQEAARDAERLVGEAVRADTLAEHCGQPVLAQAYRERAARLRAQAAERTEMAASRVEVARQLLGAGDHWRARWTEAV
jgi:hypothetical protein